MEQILLHSITVDEFMEKSRALIREEVKTALQQDQLLTWAVKRWEREI